MKLSYKKLFSAALLVSATVGFSSCDDWLDTPPQNAVTANDYFANADQLGAYAIQNYGGLFAAVVLGTSVLHIWMITTLITLLATSLHSHVIPWITGRQAIAVA